jgi:hypothetical protein
MCDTPREYSVYDDVNIKEWWYAPQAESLPGSPETKGYGGFGGRTMPQARAPDVIQSCRHSS